MVLISENHDSGILRLIAFLRLGFDVPIKLSLKKVSNTIFNEVTVNLSLHFQLPKSGCETTFNPFISPSLVTLNNLEEPWTAFDKVAYSVFSAPIPIILGGKLINLGWSER